MSPIDDAAMEQDVMETLTEVVATSDGRRRTGTEMQWHACGTAADAQNDST